MTTLSDQLSDIFIKARDQAFALLAPQVKAALPAGWSVVLSTGFPPSVSDEAGALVWTFAGPATTHYSKRRCPKALVQVMFAVERYSEIFGSNNEIIRGPEVSGDTAFALALKAAQTRAA